MSVFNKLQDHKTNRELSKKVEVKDIKAYLQEEYDRALEREKYIDELEVKEKEHKQLQVKYDALLVVQERVSERVKRREAKIKQLKEELAKAEADKVKLKNQIVDIKANAKRLVAEATKKSVKKKVAKRG